MGKDFEQPEEFMDPTVLVSKIMQLLQELVGFIQICFENGSSSFRIENSFRIFPPILQQRS